MPPASNIFRTQHRPINDTSLEVMWLGREVYHSSECIIDVRNIWSSASLLPIPFSGGNFHRTTSLLLRAGLYMSLVPGRQQVACKAPCPSSGVILARFHLLRRTCQAFPHSDSGNDVVTRYLACMLPTATPTARLDRWENKIISPKRWNYKIKVRKLLALFFFFLVSIYIYVWGNVTSFFSVNH
jgi:hypothetical protein